MYNIKQNKTEHKILEYRKYTEFRIEYKTEYRMEYRVDFVLIKTDTHTYFKRNIEFDIALDIKWNIE